MPTCADPKAAAAGGDESDRASGHEPDQAVDIGLILQRDMVMHEAGQAREPGRGAADLAAAPLVNANQTARRGGMNLAGEGLDLGQHAGGGRLAMRDEHHHVGLANGLAGPDRIFAAAEIDHQRCDLLDLVEPVGDLGRIQRPAGKHGLEPGGIDDLGTGSRPAHHACGDRRPPEPARIHPGSAPPFAPSAKRGSG